MVLLSVAFFLEITAQLGIYCNIKNIQSLLDQRFQSCIHGIANKVTDNSVGDSNSHQKSLALVYV